MNGAQGTLFGNLVRDPELRYTSNNGTPWASLRVATNRRIQNEEDETIFWDVTVWRHTAEYAARNLKTGMGVWAQGPISLRHYTRDDGQQMTVLCLNAHDFEVVTRGAPAADSWLANRPPRDSSDRQQPARQPQTATEKDPTAEDQADAPHSRPPASEHRAPPHEQRAQQTDSPSRTPAPAPRDQQRPALEPRNTRASAIDTQSPRTPQKDQLQAPAAAPSQAQPDTSEPPFDPPEDPDYSPSFYDED